MLWSARISTYASSTSVALLRSILHEKLSSRDIHKINTDKCCRTFLSPPLTKCSQCAFWIPTKWANISNYSCWNASALFDDNWYWERLQVPSMGSDVSYILTAMERILLLHELCSHSSFVPMQFSLQSKEALSDVICVTGDLLYAQV